MTFFVIERLKKERPAVLVRRLNVDKAYHSGVYFLGRISGLRRLMVIGQMSEIGSTFETRTEGYMSC